MSILDFLSSLSKGFLTGIALSLMLGTVFFALIKNSIEYGYKTGILIAIGVISSDIIFISLALLSNDFAIFLKTYEKEISIAGGCLLIVFGLFMFINSKPKNTDGPMFEKKTNSKFYFISSGFLINAVNPVNFFSWLSISTLLTVNYDFNISQKTVFFSGSLISIFLVEFLIAFGAFRIKPYIKPSLFSIINKISGSIFILFGLHLALKTFI